MKIKIFIVFKISVYFQNIYLYIHEIHLLYGMMKHMSIITLDNYPHSHLSDYHCAWGDWI